MFKNLRYFIELLPSYKLTTKDVNSFNNTLVLIKKTNETLLGLQ